MALPALFKAFPTGYRLIDGFKLNKLFTGQEQIAPVCSTLEVTGATKLLGSLSAPSANVTAIGASRASATAIPATALEVWVKGSTSAEGIALPALTSGQGLTVWPMPTIGVHVYTHAGQVINALASATALVLASAKPARFYSGDGVHIRVLKGA